MDEDKSSNKPAVQIHQSRIRINTYIKRSLYEQAMEIAKEEDETMTYVVREALKRYIRFYKSQERLG